MTDAEQMIARAPGERIIIDSPWQALVAELRTRRPGKVAVFTGRRSADVGGGWLLLQKAAAKAGRELVRFSQIEAEPCIETVEAMLEFLKAGQIAAVVALGGGSVLDAAKAALLAFQSGWKVAEHFGVNRYSSQHPDAVLERVICIPTTSGTGSEATPYSNIVDRASGVKKLISESMIIPELALIVPKLTATMPPSVTRATGCDALAHSIEGFLNIGADGNCSEANHWALESIRLITTHLPAALADGGDAEARRTLALAATLGGMVIRFKSTGLPHLCSFSWFGKLEHGIAVAMLLPACWRYYLGNPAVAERTMQLAALFPGSSPEEVIASYRSFLTRLGVPSALRDIPGITPELLRDTARSGAQNKMKLELAPRPVPVEESEKILSDILQHAYSNQKAN